MHDGERARAARARKRSGARTASARGAATRRPPRSTARRSRSSPYDAGVHNKLGICYQYLQNEAMARREYERALELDPATPRPGTTWARSSSPAGASSRRCAPTRRRSRSSPARDVLEEPRARLRRARPGPGRHSRPTGGLPARPGDPREPGAGVPSAGIDVATQNYYLAKLLALNGQNDKAIELLRSRERPASATSPRRAIPASGPSSRTRASRDRDVAVRISPPPPATTSGLTRRTR